MDGRIDFMRKILVTGADGFIGSHLTEHLVRAGYDTRPSFSTTHSDRGAGSTGRRPEIRNSLDVFAGDVRDPNGVRAAHGRLRRRPPPRRADRDPLLYHSPDTYIDTNIKGR